LFQFYDQLEIIKIYEASSSFKMPFSTNVLYLSLRDFRLLILHNFYNIKICVDI